MGQSLLLRARRAGGLLRELEWRRRLHGLLVLEHSALAAALLAGVALMHAQGWGVGYPRWLTLKLGLVLFLLLPLEGMHAWVNHAWVRRALREAGPDGVPQTAQPWPRALARGIGMDDMLRTLALPLLGVALPLMAWLSIRRPW